MSSSEGLIKQLSALLPEQGLLQTNIPGLSLIRCDDVMADSTPVIYSPCIYIVMQGKKVAYLGNELYSYDANNYLVLSVSLPLKCQIVQANPETPYLAVKIDINRKLLNEIIQEIEPAEVNPKPNCHRGMFVSELGADIRGAVQRLLLYVEEPSATKVLAPLAIKELLFRVLHGGHGAQLREFAYRDRYNFQIAKVIRYIQLNYTSKLEVPDLAARANMSQSSFHQYFKATTNFSPVQYVKYIRLHEARRKILFGNHSASDAAYYVGYASPSQFSREYRRLFGTPPSVDIRGISKRAQ